jgi:hypothetical protein
MKRQQLATAAFSLTELMVIMAIVGILAGRVQISTNPAQLIGSCDNAAEITSTLDLAAAIPNGNQLILTLPNNSPTTWVFTPRGTTTTDAELRMNLPGSTLGRCIRLLKPLGLLRSGKQRFDTCVYTTSF